MNLFHNKSAKFKTFFSLSKYEFSLLLIFFFFYFHKYTISPKKSTKFKIFFLGKIWIFLAAAIFLMCGFFLLFFFINTLFLQKISKIHDKLSKNELLLGLIFFKWGFFLRKCIIILSIIIKLSLRMTFFKWAFFSPQICQKLGKLVTNCQNMNFSQGWYFLNENFFSLKCVILLKIGKIRYFLSLNVDI